MAAAAASQFLVPARSSGAAERASRAARCPVAASAWTQRASAIAGASSLCSGRRCRLGRGRSAAGARPACVASADAALPGVTILGIGLMGAKFAARLLSRGFAVTAWNRTPAKAESLRSLGASPVPTAAAAIAASPIVLLLLSDAAAVRAALLSPGAKAALRGRTVLQMGTIGPQQSRAIAAEVAAAGGEYIEAPVLGSLPEAEKGTLLIMVGMTPGTRLESHLVYPVLTALGPAPVVMGDVGSAAAAKLALNQLIAALTVGFSTSLGLVQSHGVDLDKWMGVLRASALYAPTYDKKLARMLERDYSKPNFPTKHLAKDVDLFISEAAPLGIDTATLRGLKAVLAKTLLMGLADTDYSAVHDGVTAAPAEDPHAGEDHHEVHADGIHSDVSRPLYD